MGRLQDKVAIIAGAGSIAEGWSNGKTTAVLMAREGAKIFAIDRNLDAASETRDIILSEGGECTAYRCDVSVASEVEAMVAACIATYGRIDVLFYSRTNFGRATLSIIGATQNRWDRLSGSFSL